MTQVPSRRRIQLLYVGDAALARECLGRPGGSIEFTAAIPSADGTFTPAPRPGDTAFAYDLLLIEHGYSGVDALAILQYLRSRQIPIAVVIVADWDEHLAADALRLGASDYVIKNRASFRAVYFRLHRLIARHDQTPHQEQRSGVDADRHSDDLRAKLNTAEQARAAVEVRLQQTLSALKHARHERLTDAVYALREHAQRESEFAARIADAVNASKALDAQLGDHRLLLHAAQAELADANQSCELAAAKQSELEAALQTEGAKRRSLEAQLAHANDAVRDAERRRSADAAALADRLAQQQDEFARSFTEISRAREGLQHRVDEAIAAANHANVQRAAEASAFSAREEALRAELRTAHVDRERLERRILDDDAALRLAERQVIAAEQQGQQRFDDAQAEFHAELAGQHDVEDALNEVIVALKQALQESEDRRVAEGAAAAVSLTNLQADYDARLSAADVGRDALETELEAAERALIEARECHASEIAEAARQLGDTREEGEIRLAEAQETIRLLERRLSESESTRQRDQQHHAFRLAEAESELAAVRDSMARQLADAVASSATLERRLTESETARNRAAEEHAAEMVRATASIARKEQQTETWLTDAAAVASALENRLIDRTTELNRLREDAAAEREASIAAREAVDEQLRQSKAMLDAEIESHVAEIDRMAARLADNEQRSSSRLAQAATAIKVAESKRAEAIAALNRVVQQATAERQAASIEAAERQAQFKAELEREATQRATIERELTASRTMAAAAERRYADALAAAEEHARHDRTRLERHAADERAEWERVRLGAEKRIGDFEEQLRLTRQALAVAEDRIKQLTLDYEEAQADSARRQGVADHDLAQLEIERDGLRQSLDRTRITADETLARFTQDRSLERARLESVAADLEAQVNELTRRMQASEQAAASRLSDTEGRLREMQSARNRADETVAQLEHQLKDVRDQLDAVRKRGEQMRAAAERVPLLEHELDSVRADHRRQFEDNPASWLRCRRSGEVLHANRSMSSLLGYDDGELTRLDFGRAVFDSANDFRWMVDRCLTSMSMQSMETPWRQKHGAQIIVRLIAVPTTPDTVDLVAEDITQVRELEEKLRHAQRMEAVARYGSEVAVTCQGLLSHVKDEGQHWLAGIESDTVRYRGELLLEEVTRATAYLTQLATYSEEQQHVPALVDVNKVLRDLAPVLKRVAGEDIDVVLPKLSVPLNLDVDARPVERMLVNVAAYGRERMPLGGRLKIDVDSVVVDREFVSKHPHVRPGEHVLLTVNEQRRVVRPERVDVTDARPAGTAATFTGDSPGVDLGALQALVSECGGHLWMRAEPPGDMELKIHLPRRVLDRLDPAAAPISPARSRWIRRAFGARH